MYANFSNILEAEYKQRYWSVVFFEKLVSFLIKIGLTSAAFSLVGTCPVAFDRRVYYFQIKWGGNCIFTVLNYLFNMVKTG